LGEGYELISSKKIGVGVVMPLISAVSVDAGRSIEIAVSGFIVLMIFLAQDGHDTNDYGVNPKPI
jgi:hypothetical protein